MTKETVSNRLCLDEKIEMFEKGSLGEKRFIADQFGIGRDIAVNKRSKSC